MTEGGREPMDDMDDDDELDMDEIRRRLPPPLLWIGIEYPALNAEIAAREERRRAMIRSLISMGS